MADTVLLWGVELSRAAATLSFTIVRSTANRYASDQELQQLSGLDAKKFAAAWKELEGHGMLFVEYVAAASLLGGTAGQVRRIGTKRPNNYNPLTTGAIRY